MNREVLIEARWDEEAGIWFATSSDAPGLVVEARSWSKMIDEVKGILPELLALNGRPHAPLSLTFRAEEHFDLADA